MTKAQIHAGGRGKGGGIKTAATPEEVERVADQILGMTLITHQTGPEGKVVNQVLVEQAQDIDQELYLGIVPDRSLGRPVIMMSAAGGMEIEEVAARTPELIIKEAINPITGCMGYQARNLAFGIGLDPKLLRPAVSFIENLYRMFVTLDCSLAEINPLVVTKDGKLLALDAKLNFDDNAMFRHHDLAALEDPSEMDPLEFEARKHHLNYIRLTRQRRGHGERRRPGHGHHGPDQGGRGRARQLPGRGRRRLGRDGRPTASASSWATPTSRAC